MSPCKNKLHPGAAPPSKLFTASSPPGISSAQRGEAPTAPPPPPPEGKQGVTANATWSGRHFSQIPAAMVPMALPLPSHPGSQQREKREKKGKKKSKPAARRDQSTANAQDLPSKLWQDIPRRPFPIEHPGFGEGGWDKEKESQ